MSRNSRSLRHLSWPALLLMALVGCRQIEQKPAPRTSRRNAQNPSRAPRNRAQGQPSRSGGQNSGEGNLLLGNPSNAGRDTNNFLLDRAPYTLSYNRDNGGPNWVSWHTDASNLGDLDRSDNFAPDPDLPPDMQIRPTDYRGSSYDPGHLCPSGDRTASRDENSATFYMSNMLPQAAALNRHVWADLENYLREQIRAGNEVYEIAGGAGSAGKSGAARSTCRKFAGKSR